jgi:hypothetical protein
MAYIVQADGPGGDAASVTIEEREQAVQLALDWLKQKHAGVRIIGDGRVYLPPEFEKKDPA